MNKIMIVTAFSMFVSTQVFAFDQSKMSLGAGYGFSNNGVVSVHGDYDISSIANGQPVKARVGYDHYSIDYGFLSSAYSWSYNVFYGGAYYDANQVLELDSKIHPFIGLGIGFGSASCSGSFCGSVSSPTVGGFYYIAGVQYDATSKIAAELNFNGWGGFSLGANYRF